MKELTLEQAERLQCILQDTIVKYRGKINDQEMDLEDIKYYAVELIGAIEILESIGGAI